MDSQLTLYDVAKQMVEQNEKPLSPLEAVEKINKMCGQMLDTKAKGDAHYMLINPDLKQYVVILVKSGASPKKLNAEMQEIIFNRGQLMMIDSDEVETSKVWEIWLKDIYTQKVCMYQLIDYTSNIVEVK